MSSIPGIETGAPERTETSSGSAGSPKRSPLRSSSAASASSTSPSSPGGGPLRMYSTQASVVTVKPPGTGLGPSTWIISARFAPLFPSSSRISAEPSLRS